MSRLKKLNCTASGNWFEHFERFVQQILYVRSFVVAGLQV